jgi:VanZ family protein
MWVARQWRLLFWLAIVSVTVASLLPLQSQASFAVSDKLQHFAAYAVLATLASASYGGRWAWWAIGVALVAFSGAIELAQGLSGYRYAEWLDLLANTAGVAAGLVLTTLQRRWFN